MPASQVLPAAPSKSISFSCSDSSSAIPQFVVDASQALAQTQHRIALPGEQRIHAHAGFFSHFLEAAPFQFVTYKDFPLFVRQFFERKLQLLQKHVANINRLWACFR